MNLSEYEFLQDQENERSNTKPDNFAFRSPITNLSTNLSMFKRFSDFVFSLLGNLDIRALDKRERQAFERFLHYRNEKAKLTYATKKALLEQALELKDKDQDLVKCLEQSIRKGYNEIYALMEFKPSFKPPKHEEQEESYEYKPNPKYNGHYIW